MTALSDLRNATSVLMLTVCGMIIASGVLNMQQYNLVANIALEPTAPADKVEQRKKDMDYIEMANKWYGVDTALGAVVGALILAMMTYQLGKGNSVDAGFKGASYVQYIFAFVAYAVIIMNSAFGLNVYKKAPGWAEQSDKCQTSASMRPQMTPMQLRQKAMMAARARALGVENQDDKAVKYASDVNKVNIAFIVISTVFFAAYVVYIGYNSKGLQSLRGGGRYGGMGGMRHYKPHSKPSAYSTFFTY